MDSVEPATDLRRGDFSRTTPIAVDEMSALLRDNPMRMLVHEAQT
jgi:hypothetical protein